MTEKKWKEIQKTENIKFEINYYSGEKWNPDLVKDLKEKYKFKSIKDFCEFWEEELKFMYSYIEKEKQKEEKKRKEEEENNNYHYSNHNDLHYKRIEDNVDLIFEHFKKNDNEVNAELKNLIIEKLNNIDQKLKDVNYAISKSFVGKGLFELLIKNNDFHYGYKSYYFNDDSWYPDNGNKFRGYLHAFYFPFPNKSKKASESIQKTFWEMEDEIIKIKNEKEKIIEERQKLMLSGPIKMWYNKLELYTGKIYKLKQDKKIEYNEKNKKWLIRGKIRWNIFATIFWALTGISLVILMFCLLIFSEFVQKSNNWRILTLISILGSFVLFIYGYILKIFVKNWLSSRHISESIQERIALTQFYLSLIQQDEHGEKSEQINDSDRTYAIQAIFKKINTGLIKDEHDNKFNILEFFMNKMKN